MNVDYRGAKQILWGAVLVMGLAGCGASTAPENALLPGQTDFITTEPGDEGGGRYAPGDGQWNSPSAGAAEDANKSAAPSPAPPQGRTGPVEEADIYKVDDNRLFYLNTYRGFVIYDLADPKNPKRVSRLPVYGYPIEMFVVGDTVYALLRDALYLTQKNGKLQFERHNVSQLLAIDVSDLKNPKVLQTVDIVGELREGVSRKVEDTVYVVSYLPQHYWWGWGYNRPSDQQREQAWVYSFNVADPQNLKLVQKLKIFEGGSYEYEEPTTGAHGSRSFSEVALSATSNTLMVVENWWLHGYVPGHSNRCSSYQSAQEAVVSIVDISDPQGTIKVHAKFSTAGQLRDQFKQTYVFDETTGKATYYGIFARQEWSSSSCSGSRFTANIIEAWDVTDGANPTRSSWLRFGKPDETVRGSAFDSERGVAYAITARQIDPLYVIDLRNPASLKILSEIDGLSGDMNVFRLIGNREYLIGIGRDNTAACTGFETASGGRATNVAASIIDVRDLSAIRLVQRQCVAIENAEWVGSSINWNLDQAHKMIGMFSDSKVNLLSVPVYYYSKSNDDGWWWYDYKTAVGLMTWDLAQYDDTKSPAEQQVFQNFGTVLHPHGEVKRSILFTHKGASERRMMINLSDTHASITDIEDLSNPQSLSVIEVAPYVGEIFGFGGHVVEHVRSGQYYAWRADDGAKSEFRVKPAGGALEDTAAVASFSAGQVQRVIKHGNKLVLFRLVENANASNNTRSAYGTPYDTEVLVYDLTTPTKPIKGGAVKIPGSILPYYHYWCGDFGYWGGYWFDADRNWTLTDSGIVFLNHGYDYQTNSASRKLVFVDLSELHNPKVSDYALTSADTWTFFGLVADPVDPTAFFLAYRIRTGQLKVNDRLFNQYKYYAQRWTHATGGWSGSYAVNLPGQLIRTWDSSSGQRLFLTHDSAYTPALSTSGESYWKRSFRLNLLRELDLAGKPAAELRDTHDFADLALEGLVIDGDKLFVNARKNYYWYERAAGDEPTWEELSDRLMIMDISQLTLATVYDEPTATSNVQLMGTHLGKLFVNLPGDGVLVVDVTNPAQPYGQQFMRTLGWASHIEFAADTAYVAAGHFGVFQLKLSAPPSIELY